MIWFIFIFNLVPYLSFQQIHAISQDASGRVPGFLRNLFNMASDPTTTPPPTTSTNNGSTTTEAPGYIDLGLNNVSIDSLGWFSLKETDVHFRLVTRKTCLNYQVLKIGRLANNSFIQPNQPFKIITHGFQSGIDTVWAYNMTAEYVKKGDYNIIQVDWSDAARSAYPLAARYTKSVGFYLAKLIADLNQNLSVPVSNMHLIGHSLGSHIMGFAGAYVQQFLKQKVSRITGLDPAGPLFLRASASSRLEKTDATFVDIIHTDGMRYGYYDPMGDADFYPNGGTAVQPPCRSGLSFAGDLVGAGCSHGYSHEYFTESIQSSEFIGRQCDNYLDYQVGQCRFNTKEYKTAVMGENISPSASGIFYLDVNSSPPFATNNKIVGLF